MFEWETGARADIAYMVDQSHNLKEKIEEMIQTAKSVFVSHLERAGVSGAVFYRDAA